MNLARKLPGLSTERPHVSRFPVARSFGGPNPQGPQADRSLQWLGFSVNLPEADFRVTHHPLETSPRDSYE